MFGQGRNITACHIGAVFLRYVTDDKGKLLEPEI